MLYLDTESAKDFKINLPAHNIPRPVYPLQHRATWRHFLRLCVRVVLSANDSIDIFVTRTGNRPKGEI